MLFKDSTTQFGVISKFFHWTIALLVLTEVYLIYWREWMLPPKSEIGNFYINDLHKPIGMTVLGLALLAIVWRILTQRPKFPNNMTTWERAMARIVHLFLFASVIVMPITGVVMSVAAGYPPSFFGFFQVPQFLEKNSDLAHLFFNIHSTTGFTTIGVVVLHTLAALKHHFINRDTVLKRMLP